MFQIHEIVLGSREKGGEMFGILINGTRRCGV